MRSCQNAYSGPWEFSFCFLALRNSSTASHLCLLSRDRYATFDFNLLCRLLRHLALKHEVLEDVGLDDQLESLRGPLDGEKAERVQLLRLQGSKVKQRSRLFCSPRGT